VGARFSAPIRPGPPNLLYSGYEVSSLGIKRPVRGVDHSPLSTYTSTPPLWLLVIFEGDLYLCLKREIELDSRDLRRKNHAVVGCVVFRITHCL